MKRISVLAVVGPTAAGKSALAMTLAKALHGEIVCMDSMQVYQGMDIGTAKPTRAEQAALPHHMLDIVGPREAFTVAEYADRATPVLQDIQARGRLPLLVGGTGLYLRALLQGMPLGKAGKDERLRERLWSIAGEEGGRERLHGMLRVADPESAAKLHPNDLRRVIRALEVFEVTGLPMSQQNEEIPESPFHFCILGATMEREALYQRIDRRVDGMLQAGLVQEVEGLLQAGVSPLDQSMQGIGYKELVPVLRAGLPLEQGAELLKRNTRRYAKRQWTWFRGEPEVQWLDMLSPKTPEKALGIAREFWENRQSKEDCPS